VVDFIRAEYDFIYKAGSPHFRVTMLVVCKVYAVSTIFLGNRSYLLAIHANAEMAVHAAESILGARMRLGANRDDN